MTSGYSSLEDINRLVRERERKAGEGGRWNPENVKRYLDNYDRIFRKTVRKKRRRKAKP